MPSQNPIRAAFTPGAVRARQNPALANPRAVHRFTETLNCSNYLFLRHSGRKTVTHFSWNCSKTVTLAIPAFASK
ncbi:MAG: hypothetical protein E5W96_20260 [Mesorhizobium sp.]|nr:MAG: hypothetical protein E5W96_20260 [Mesorhizobium sp.]